MPIRRGGRVLVTGGAGFIGSHVVDRLVEWGCEVVVYDNLSTGNRRFLAEAEGRFEFVKADLSDEKRLLKAMDGVDYVFHLAANADIKENLKEPLKCLRQNTVTTSNVLEAMRKGDVRGIAFTSSGSVYGEPSIHPTPEDAPFPVQTSMYGASKLACEGLIQAYAEGYGFEAKIFRMVSLMGERYSHGCVFDFYRKLLSNPKELEILGDGRQRKSYLYVKDAVDGMLLVSSTAGGIKILNLGHEDTIEVTQIAKIVCEELGLGDVRFRYSGGERGWVGDSPYIQLDVSRMKSLRWAPTRTIPECVRLTMNWIKENRWVLKERR